MGRNCRIFCVGIHRSYTCQVSRLTNGVFRLLNHPTLSSFSFTMSRREPLLTLPQITSHISFHVGILQFLGSSWKWLSWGLISKNGKLLAGHERRPGKWKACWKQLPSPGQPKRKRWGWNASTETSFLRELFSFKTWTYIKRFFYLWECLMKLWKVFFIHERFFSIFRWRIWYHMSQGADECNLNDAKDFFTLSFCTHFLSFQWSGLCACDDFGMRKNLMTSADITQCNLPQKTDLNW